jgi:hypothetical protein
MSDQLNEESPSKTILEITAEQLTQLENLLELAKTIGSAEQLALAGLLAARPGESIAVVGLLPQLTVRTKNSLPRLLRQLEKAGFIQIQQWDAPRPGQEPEPSLITFNPNYAKQAQTMIAALRHVITLDTDEAKPLVMDERAATLKRFMKDGKLVGMPVQVKRQQYILEEVARTFEPGIRYTEREVDAILKPIFDDHCTLRRSLVDFKYLHRAGGVYWKENPVLAPV